MKGEPLYRYTQEQTACGRTVFAIQISEDGRTWHYMTDQGTFDHREKAIERIEKLGEGASKPSHG